MAEPKRRCGNEDGLEKYLVPFDTIPKDIALDGISMDDLEEMLDEIECQQMALIMDTCFSGGARSISTGPATRNTTVSSSFLKKLGELRKDKHRKILVACSADELAQDDPDTRHGIFTSYFLEGLEEAEDSDGNGVISLYEVFGYLSRKVRERSSELGQRQHPDFVGDPAYAFKIRDVTN